MGNFELNSVIIENTHIDDNSQVVVESMKEVFFDVFECKIGKQTLVFEKVGDVDGNPLVICNVNLKGKTYVTEAVLKIGDKPGVSINENNLQVVVTENLITEKDEKVLKEEIQQETLNKVNTKTDVTELLAETLQEYNNKRFEEKISNYTKIYENKVFEFEKKKADYLNTLHKNFNKSISNINEDIDKRLDTFFKKTDVNQKTVLEAETDKLKLEVASKYKDFLKEVTNTKEFNKQTIDNLLSEKTESIQSAFKVFVDKITNDNKDMLLSRTKIEEMISDNNDNSKVINEKIQDLENLKETVISIDEHKKVVDSTNKKFKKILETVNDEFNKLNKKVKLISEAKNQEYNDLLAAVNKKDSIEYKTILTDKINEAELSQIKQEILKEVTGNFNNEVSTMRRYASMVAGGGTNAVQYANGGTMNGDLTVNGTMKADTILATSLLSATNLNITHELSGFAATGNITTTKDLVADNNIVANNIIAQTTLGGTLSTASQPNITSVGTLTDLTVTNGVSANVFNGSGAQLTGLPAEQLTGTIDNARIAASNVTQHSMSITDFGALTATSLGVGITTAVSPLHIKQDNSATDATAGITVENDGTGDAVVQYLLSGTRRWVTGIDNSDSDKFKFAYSADVGSDNAMELDTSGNVTSIGVLSSTSTTSRPVQSDESDADPVRSIRRMTQSAYDSLSPKDPNTLYIIV